MSKDERYTPPEIFSGLKLLFDLDPFAASDNSHVPARRTITLIDDGFSRDWEGMVWMNPPWTGRNAQVPAIKKFIQHGNGVGVALAYTSSGWFQELMPQMDAILFPRGKTRYILTSGKRDGSPPMGSVLFAMGELPVTALRNSGLGMFIEQPALF